jgi:hypothetical protein
MTQTERMKISTEDVEVRLNRPMQTIFGRLDLVQAEASLPNWLHRVALSGVALLGDRVYLREYWASRAGTAEQMDRWSAERWVNDVSLDSPLPPSDASWRPQLLGWGWLVALSLLNDASERRCPFDLQVDLNLQSVEGKADPEIDYSVGALHVYSLQEAGDDLSLAIEKFEQPTATLTKRPRP